VDKLKNKLKGWKEKKLSLAGRQIFINIVAQAILMYSLSCGMLPQGICEKFVKARCSFWWGSKEGQSKVH